MKHRRPAFSRGVLIDTSAYFAFTDRDDVKHSAAQEIFARLAEIRRPLVEP